MNPKPALQTLPLECLLEILSYVQLPECMFLRKSSRQLKYAVDEHFRSNVQTLPVLLSARYSSGSVASFIKQISKRTRVEEMTFGSTSGVSQRKIWERKSIFLGQKEHFRRNNYLVLFDIAKFDSFVAFITKYLPGITKLALLIDHKDHFQKIPTILNLYQKQLKVLLLEKTERFVFAFVPDSNNYNPRKLEYTTEICDSIDSFDALEELYFFATWGSFTLSKKEILFVDRMFAKLRILHMNFLRREGKSLFRSEPYEKLEEIGCYSAEEIGGENYAERHSFPNVKKCVILFPRTTNSSYLESKFMPNLEDIIFNGTLEITTRSISALDNYPNLNRFHCDSIYVSATGWSDMRNRTVKFMEVNQLHYSTDWKDFQKCLTYFQGLERVVIQKPFIELTGSDLRDPEYIPGFFAVLDSSPKSKKPKFRY